MLEKDIKHLTGQLNDLVNVPYQFGINTILAHLNTSYYHVHGQSFVYPSHADDILLTAGAGAWNLTGAITEIIPVNVLNVSAFDLHWINIHSISANGTIQVDIYAGTVGNEVLITSTKATRTAVQSQNGPKRIQIPQQPVNTRISCRLSDNTAGQINCRVSFEGHYYA
jgi:hypothetical protein